MQVKILGGHGGVSPSFNVTSYMLGDNFLIDAGAVASGLEIVDQKKVDHILVSHPHLDHIKDLAFLCDNCFGLRSSPFEVHTNQTIINAIKAHLLNDVIWPDFTRIPNAENPTMRFNSVPTEQWLTIGDYRVMAISVNHPCDAMGFIIEQGDASVLFTQDTGPTEKIWEYGKKQKNLKAIFTEVSFPNKMKKVARDSFHHTAESLALEVSRMPKDIPIYLGHLKPNYQDLLIEEIHALKNPRLQILLTDDMIIKF